MAERLKFRSTSLAFGAPQKRGWSQPYIHIDEHGVTVALSVSRDHTGPWWLNVKPEELDSLIRALLAAREIGVERFGEVEEDAP